MNLKSASTTVLLGCVGLALVAALAWLGLIGPALGDLAETNESRRAAQDRNDAMRLELARLRGQAEDLPAREALGNELQEMFPPTAAQATFFAQLAGITAAAGIGPEDVTTLSPGVPTILEADPSNPSGDLATTQSASGATVDPPTQVSDIAVQTIELQVNGDYDALIEVLDGIERLRRAFLVDTVDVDAGEERGLTLSVGGRIFVAPAVMPAVVP